MQHANTLLQQAADFLGSINDDAAVQNELRSRQQQRYRALRVLHRYQRYRRGAGSYTDIGYTPTEIGRAIDFAIRELRSHFRPEETSVPAAFRPLPGDSIADNADDNTANGYVDGTGYHPY